MHDLKALKYDSCVTFSMIGIDIRNLKKRINSESYLRLNIPPQGITQFYLPPTHKPYLPYSPAARRHHPLADTNFYCLVNRGT